MAVTRRRAIIAGVLGVVYPGLGHVYLRAWLRAGAWFLVAIVAVAVALPPSAVDAARSGGFDAIVAASRDLPTSVVVVITGIRLLNAVDAVWIALNSTRRSESDDDTATCPHCGGDLDPDLEFCPWCSTEIGGETTAPAETTSR